MSQTNTYKIFILLNTLLGGRHNIILCVGTSQWRSQDIHDHLGKVDD